MPEPRRFRFAALILVAGTAAGVAIGAALALARGSTSGVVRTAPALHAQTTWPAGARRAPAMRLRDQNGRLASPASLRGRPLLVTFLDSHCRQQCPIEGRMLTDVVSRLGARAPADLLVVSVDPWADTARSVRAFAKEAGWPGRWRWLLGTVAQLKSVWAAWGVGVRRTPTDIAHTAVVFLVDRRGFLRAAYLVPFSPREVATDLVALS